MRQTKIAPTLGAAPYNPTRSGGLPSPREELGPGTSRALRLHPMAIARSARGIGRVTFIAPSSVLVLSRGMKRDTRHLRLAATDVTTFAACAHATALDLAVASGQRPRPPFYPDVTAPLLRERGLAHEAAYLARLRETRTVEEIAQHAPDAAGLTLSAMQRGADVIYQGALQRGEWFGRPDFLVRVAEPRGAWGWSYEPVDAKLALTAKVQGLLQLCF